MILLADLADRAASLAPSREALRHEAQSLSYAELANQVRRARHGLFGLGIRPKDRVVVFVEKRLETVISMLAIAQLGAIFVPVNPLYKRDQVLHVLKDCQAVALVTSTTRLKRLHPVSVPYVVTVDAQREDAPREHQGESRSRTPERVGWSDLLDTSPSPCPHESKSGDHAAIVYTSGSSGLAKGVVLSHHNLACAAQSVNQYLGQRAEDRLMAILPLSFDAGFTQVSSGLYAGATVVLMDYLLPREAIQTMARERITGMTAVPPIWAALSKLHWAPEITQHLRYIASTGGILSAPSLTALRSALPKTSVYLMYGFTEAFRATYLPPSELDRRPNSVGQPIPFAELEVLDSKGQPCETGQVGELVQSGDLVSQGYWNQPEATAERFKTYTLKDGSATRAVWSGDLGYKDEAGFFYFVSRNDEMIKTSGYRVSPTEIESVIQDSAIALEVVAGGVPHQEMGQVIAIAAVPSTDHICAPDILEICRQRLPSYMVPSYVLLKAKLPRGHNGKLDRLTVLEELRRYAVKDELQ